jgi:hypothetical protein
MPFGTLLLNVVNLRQLFTCRASDDRSPYDAILGSTPGISEYLEIDFINGLSIETQMMIATICSTLADGLTLLV